MANNPDQLEKAKQITEPLLYEALQGGYVLTKPSSKEKQFYTSWTSYVRYADTYEDINLHFDIEAYHNKLRYRYDVKQRTLPTKFSNFTINKSCFDFLESVNIKDDEYQRYFFAFALDNGNEYTGEFLIVKGEEVLNISDEHKQWKKLESKRPYCCISEEILRQQPSAIIIESDI